MFRVKTAVSTSIATRQSSAFGLLAISESPRESVGLGIKINRNWTASSKSSAIQEVPSDNLLETISYFSHTDLNAVESIVSIFVDGISYKIDYGINNLGSLQSKGYGGWTHVPSSQVGVVIDPEINANFSKSTAVISYRYQEEVKPNSSIAARSNVICNHPSIGILEAFNTEGTDLVLNESIGEPPSLSAINIAVCADKAKLIVEGIENGREFSTLDHKWIVEKVSVSYSPQINRAIISIQPVHWSVSRGEPSLCPLDMPVLIKKSSSDGILSAIAIADSVGAKYYGASISQKVKRSAGSEDTTTLREMIASRLITRKRLPFYEKDYISSFKWRQSPIKTISTSEITGSDGEFLETTSIAGNGRIEGGVQLFSEYRNTKVELESTEVESDPEKAGITTRWVFEGCTSFTDLISDNEFKGFYYEAPSQDILRTPGVCFDNGGQTKRASKITELNGTITIQEDWEYGYAFTSLDSYEVVSNLEGNYKIQFKGGFTSTYWIEVAHSTTKHIFDKDGYLEKTVKSGWQLARMSQESDKLEAITLMFKAIQASSKQQGIVVPDASLVNQSNSYKFDQRLPISEVTEYTLHLHSDYFKNTVKPSDACDRDFVPAKFVANKITSGSSRIIAKNPKNSKFYTYPDLVTTKSSVNSESVAITNKHFPYMHETRLFEQNSEGSYAKNTIAIRSATQSSGQPSTALRIDRSATKPTVLRGISDNSRYFINASVPITQEGSLSYPGVDNISDAIEIARVEQSIKNTKNAYTKSFSIMFRDDLRVGDHIIFRNRRWVLLAKTDSRRVRKDFATSTDLNVTLGLFLNPSLQITNRSAINDCQSASEQLPQS